MNLSKFPPEPKALPQWVARRHDKKPVNPITGELAEANNPATWNTYTQAIKYYEAHKNNGIAGIGYEFSYYDPFCGIDLDHGRDSETGTIEPWAWEIIKRFNSYTEISPSGTGVHIWIKGKFPKGAGDHQKNLPGGGKIEAYDVGRYFTVTGNHLEGTPETIEDRDKEFKAFHAQVIARPKTPPKAPGPSPTLSLADSEVIEKARSAQNGNKFERLMRGDTSEYGGDDSSADLALCSILAFWTQDPGQIERIFKTSGLMRDKWDRPTAGSTYGQKTIDKALAGVSETYQGPRSAPKNENTPKQEAPERTPEPEKLPPDRRGPQPHKSPQAPAIQFVTGSELQSIKFKDPAWVVPGILPEGLCLLSARPKKGKTWLALDVSVAKSSGGCALGKSELRLSRGKVLYLCLEDKLRRAQKRLEKIMEGAPFPSDLILAESWPKLDKGGMEALQDFLKEHDDCKMVVIDSYVKIKPQRPKNVDPYDFDMAVAGDLQSLAQERQVCILLIYHNRKSESEDPLDDVIGSTGLTGAVDAVLILRRGRGQADGFLFVTGRDVEEQELALKFHPGEGLWELLGDAAEYAKSQERIEIINLLREQGPKTPKEIAETLNKKSNNIKQILWQMAKGNEVKSNGGRYEAI